MSVFFTMNVFAVVLILSIIVFWAVILLMRELSRANNADRRASVLLINARAQREVQLEAVRACDKVVEQLTAKEKKKLFALDPPGRIMFPSQAEFLNWRRREAIKILQNRKVK